MTIAYHDTADSVSSEVDRAPRLWDTRYSMPARRPSRPVEEDFGELLRRLRDRAGFSQEAFAQAVGLSRKTIYSIENTKGRPAFTDEIPTVTKMAEVLKMPVSVLSLKLGWMPSEECVDWRAGLLSDKRLSDDDRDALSHVIERFGL